MRSLPPIRAEYQKAYAETATHLINANAALMELEPMIHAPEHCSPHGLRYVIIYDSMHIYIYDVYVCNV